MVTITALSICKSQAMKTKHGNILNHVLIHLGCYKRRPPTQWLINNRHLFLMIMEAEKSKIKALADLVFSESPCSGSQRSVFHYPPSWQKEGGNSPGPSVRTLIHFMRAPPSWSEHFPTISPLNVITLGIRFQCIILGGTQAFNLWQTIRIFL